jgi:hypothetical protein
VRPLDVKGVENGNGVCNAGRKRVGARFAWLVASALTAVVGEDQAEFAASDRARPDAFAISSGSAKPV